MNEEPLDARDYLRPIWTYRWMILVTVVVVTAATYFYYQSRPKVYEANSSILVQDATGLADLFPSQAAATSDDRNTLNQAFLLRSRRVAREVANQLRFNGSPDELRAKTIIAAEDGQDYISVTAMDSSAEGAAAIANAYASVFIALREKEVSSLLFEERRRSERQLDARGSAQLTQSARESVRNRLRRLDAVDTRAARGVQAVDSALAPASPIEPRPWRNAIFAFLVSALLAILAAFGLERIDRRIKSAEDFERIYNSSVLAMIPHAGDPIPSNDGKVGIAPELREPFRSLRANLRLQTLDQPPKTILVTSALPSEGKSTVVRNLALAYREAGYSVAIVEADLRRPTLGRMLIAQPKYGLTDVLLDRASLEEALTPVAVPTAELTPALARNNPRQNGGAPEGTLAVLTSGGQPSNPPAVLGTRRMSAVLEQVAADFDCVIVDSPPLLPVSDTLGLLQHVDGVLLVARVGLTTREAAKRARDTLARVPGSKILGLVVDDVPSGRFGNGSGYGYGYGYG